MTTTEIIATISICLLIVGVYFFNKYVIEPAEKLAEERETDILSLYYYLINRGESTHYALTAVRYNYILTKM